MLKIDKIMEHSLNAFIITAGIAIFVCLVGFVFWLLWMLFLELPIVAIALVITFISAYIVSYRGGV